MSFKNYNEDCLPDDFCFLLIWMQVIKALQSDSTEHFKTMKHESENIKPQQYPEQDISKMSLDVTYCCKALTTAGIWDHQLCSSILFAFLCTDGTEIHCHSLIAMKATLEDELRKVRFMDHADGTTHRCSKGGTYGDICDLAKTWYQEGKGMAKCHPNRTLLSSGGLMADVPCLDHSLGGC